MFALDMASVTICPLWSGWFTQCQPFPSLRVSNALPNHPQQTSSPWSPRAPGTASNQTLRSSHSEVEVKISHIKKPNQNPLTMYSRWLCPWHLPPSILTYPWVKWITQKRPSEVHWPTPCQVALTGNSWLSCELISTGSQCGSPLAW